MANEVTIVVKARNETKAGFDAARRDAATLGTDMGTTITEKITERITQVSRTSGMGLDQAGDTMGDSIGKRIRDRIREHVRVAFDRIRGGRQNVDVDTSGRQTVHVDVDEGSRRTLLQRFTDLGNRLGEKVQGGLQTGLQAAFSGDTITLIIKAVAGALVAAVSLPAIGAAFVGAILLALGGGALALGIVGAIKDPRVSGAISQIGDQLGELVKKFGEPFKGPLADFLEDLSRFLDSPEFVDNLMAIADAFAPIVGELGQGFIGMLQNAMPGITDAAIAAAPLFKMLAEKLPRLGQAMGDFFRDMAEGAPGAIQFLSDLLDFIVWIIPKVGAVAAAFSNVYLNVRSVVKAIIGELRRLADSAGHISSTVRSAFSRAASAMSAAFNAARARIVGAFNAIRNNVAAVVDSIVAKINWLKDTIASIKGRTINIATNIIGGARSLLGFAHGGIVGAASGGIHGGLRLVGESGPELAELPPGTRVHPAGATQRMMQGGGRSSDVTLRFARDAEGPLGRALLQMLRGEIRAQGGNVQTVLGT